MKHIFILVLAIALSGCFDGYEGQLEDSNPPEILPGGGIDDLDGDGVTDEEITNPAEPDDGEDSISLNSM